MKNIKEKIELMKIYQTNTFSSVGLKLIKSNDTECILFDVEKEKYYLCELKPIMKPIKKIELSEINNFANK